MASNSDTEGLTPKQKLFQEAKKRFKACVEFEGNQRKLFLDDIKFDAADPDNGFQWPNSLLNSRDKDTQPCLTINKTRQLNRQIINDGKQNTPSMKFIPVSGGTSVKSAEVFTSIGRHIEYISNAKACYDTAYSFAVRGGIGYWRLCTDYVRDDTFDQDIFIRRVKDPLSVYLDPDINEVDGSDAKFGFVFEDRERDEVLDEYPDLRDKLTNAVIGDPDSHWITRDHIRIAEYYRKVTVSDKLVLLTEPDTMPDGSPNPRAGQQSVVKASDVPREILNLAMKMPDTKMREISREVVEWYKIVGEEIVEERSRAAEKAKGPEYGPFPIPYIPIVRVIGEETVIDGKLDRKGHTRAIKDAQRMFNYNASAAVQYGALQAKSPWIASARAIEGYETYWETANKTAHSILPYNDVDDEGKPLQKPERVNPPTGAPVFMQGMQDAQQQMMMASGQYEYKPGEQRDGTGVASGKAINARQRQGDNATYHYIDNLAAAVRLTGKIIMAWVPHVYDTERVIKVIGEDGSEKEITVNPAQKEALVEKEDARTKAAASIFNPKVGKYDVMSDVGPGYATKRQEAFNAYSQIAMANPAALDVMGDYVFLTMDVPYASEIAERWRRKIPANILGDGPTPELQAANAQLENVKGLLTDVVTQLAEKDLENKRLKADKGVAEYKAETERVVQAAKLVPSIAPEVLVPLVTQAVTQALSQIWPPGQDDTQEPAALPDSGKDLPPLNDLSWDIRSQVDGALSNGNPNG